MHSQDPIGTAVPPERPVNPTHFGGEGLYERPSESSRTGQDASLKVPLGEHLDRATRGSLDIEQNARSSPSKSSKVPMLLAIGGIAWLLALLVRRSTERS